jgi:spermidine synthase
MKNLTDKNSLALRWTGPLILTFLLFSGTCGLIYEILWMKMLTLVIGNTVFSITTVLTAFMGGLALGSFLAGRLEDKIKNPLRIYGLLEGGIGAYALLVPFLIVATEPLFRFIYQNVNPSFYGFSLLRFFVCGIILLVPTTLMGATLPVISKYFVKRQTHLGWTVSKIYGVNTFGAVLGSFAAGFILIPRLGITLTIYSAAFLNLAIAACVLILFRNRPQVELEEKKEEFKEKEKKKKKKKKREIEEGVIQGRWKTITFVVMAGIGLSGVAAMIYQIAWTRVLSLSIGSSVYAFSLIVTAFICGLALGSLFIGKFIDRRKHLVLGLAVVEGIIGISALLVVPLLGKLPVVAAKSVFSSINSFKHIHFAEFGIIFPLLLIPTFMMGAAVPMAIKICARDVKRVGKFFGNVYAANTLGAIFGSFIAGFLLIPWLGAQKSIFFAVSMNIFVAVIIVLHAPTLAIPRRVAVALVTAVIAVVLWYPISTWDTSILTSGPYLYADLYKNVSVQKGLELEAAMKEGYQLLFFKEGLNAVVSVKKTTDGDLVLEINGKADATAKSDAATQLMLGHLPLLLHQSAEDALIIGLGSGMTLGAVERYPVKAVDVVEIERAVVEASKYFQDFTGDALNDQRVSLIVADGRNHLALTHKQYDVIISEPSNPWISGMANLFTREFFELAKRRLRKGGLMCQWVHAYSMSSVDFKTIVRTFHTAFPHVMVWEASLGGDYLLIGSPEDLNIDYQMLLGRLDDESMRADLVKMNITDLASFLNRLVITKEAIAEYTKGASLHTDDNSLLEYSAPKALLEGRSTVLLDELYHCRSDPVSMLRSLLSVEITAEIQKDLLERFEARKEVLRGYIRYAKGAAQDAIKKFEDALVLSPDDYDATYLLAKLNYEIGNLSKNKKRPNEATKSYEKSIKAIDNFIKGDRALLSGHFDLEVLYAKANLDLGTTALKANRLEQAAEAFKKSTSGEVRYAGAHNNLGIVYERTGRYDAAVNQYQLAIELDPNLVSAHMNIGNTRIKQEKFKEAIESYHQIQKLRPDFALTNYNLGVAYFKQNQWAKAEKEWMRAMELNPDFSEAQKKLNDVREKIK